MGNMDRRLDRQEGLLLGGNVRQPESPLEDQLEGVLDMLRCHKWGGSVYLATDRELELLDALIDQGVVPRGGARELFTRMNPAR
jgi:hypothetical protein